MGFFLYIIFFLLNLNVTAKVMLSVPICIYFFIKCDNRNYNFLCIINFFRAVMELITNEDTGEIDLSAYDDFDDNSV